MNKLMIGLLSLTLLVSLNGCAEKSDSAGSSEPAAANEIAQKPQPAPQQPPQPTKSNKPAKPAQPVQPNGPNKQTQVQKQYYMNKNYFFKPINSAAPKKAVLLTFDDGPKEKPLLESILGTLDKHKAKAIFFVNGYRVKEHPELLKLIHDRKQTIGNHSWDHIDLKKQSAQKVKQQLTDVQTIVKKVTGTSPAFFRPPFGSGGDTVRKTSAQLGMLYMTWSNGSEDWLGKNKNKPDQVIATVMKQLNPGSNILMHELPWTAEALDELLTLLESKGYTFIDPAAIDPHRTS
ncbi:polysaccharide deacetylase family protein [Paenibacillus gansuensis]|uniref:Polysaccharide deacetylase family protein n=1 Tax=Paenibacillus gansuensis TaxID=306542 RepID=A0ABW5PAT3_9BACL